jgi:hypothetical protein
MLDTSPRRINPCIVFCFQFPSALIAKDRDEFVHPAEENTLAAALIAPHTGIPAIIKLFVSLHLIRAFKICRPLDATKNQLFQLVSAGVPNDNFWETPILIHFLEDASPQQ